MAASKQHLARRTRNPRKASKTAATVKAKSTQRLKTTAPKQRCTRTNQRDKAGGDIHDHQRHRLNSLREWQRNLGQVQPESLSDLSLIVEPQKSLQQGLSYYALPLIPLVSFLDELRGRSIDEPQRMINVLCDLVESIITCISMVKENVSIRSLEKMLHGGDMLFHTAIVRCVGSGSHPYRHPTLKAAEHATAKMAFYHEQFGRALWCMPQCMREEPGVRWKQAFFPVTKDYLRRFSTEPEESLLSKNWSDASGRCY